MTVMVEIKRPKGGKLNKLQQDFRDSWRGLFAVVRTVEEAIELARGMREVALATPKIWDLRKLGKAA